MTKIKIALEWFLNPDHLPMIVGIQSGSYTQAGLEVELIEPKEHYDGFELLNSKEIDIHVNEPLHLFEHYFDGIKSLGCFFETRGGVMIKSQSMPKLKANKPIRITTPASNDVTNTIGFEILKRYAQKNGFELSKENVEFIQTDFYHIKNMQEGDYDGAWLCFYNFEGIEAEFKSFSNTFIDALESPYPNFSALELMTSQEILDSKKEYLAEFVKITSQMSEFCQENPQVATKMFYDYSKQEQSQLMDKIIDDTIPRFETNISSDSKRWHELCEFLSELKLVNITQTQYDKIWS